MVAFEGNLMFESLSRGWTMTKASFRVLSLDKEILALPLMAGVLLVAIIAVGVTGLSVGALDAGPAGIVGLLVFYFLAYGVIIFFNAAVIEMATIRFNGGDPVIKDGLRKAWAKKGRIVQWAVVAATVGLLFAILRRMVRQQDSVFSQILGSILVSIAETAWNLATFFVVPLAIYQDMGPMDAIKSSTRRMKQTFGESIAGIATTGIIFFLFGLLGLVPFYLGMVTGSTLVMAVAVVYWVVLAAVNAAVDGILVAALYKYSVDGSMPSQYREQGIQAENVVW